MLVTVITTSLLSQAPLGTGVAGELAGQGSLSAAH